MTTSNDTPCDEHAESRSPDAESGGPVLPTHEPQSPVQQDASDPEQRAMQLLSELTDLATRYTPGEEGAAHNDARARICRELDHLIETGAVSRGRVALLANVHHDHALGAHLDMAINGDPTQRAISAKVLCSCRPDLLQRALARKEKPAC